MDSEAESEHLASILSQDRLLILRGPRHRIPRLGDPGRGKLRPGGGGNG